MSTVGNVNSAATGTSAVKSAMNNQEDRFFKLLVAQLRNQDPMSPLDNAQVTSQMAQISTVTGIDKLNATMQGMMASYSASQALQATTMLGHAVLATGNTLQLKDDKAAGGVDLANAADSVVITVRDAAGLIVHKVDMGAQEAGVLNFQWDGMTDSGTKAAAGTYKFTVEALQGGKKVDAAPLALGIVNSMTQGSNGVALNVSGIGLINLSDIRQVM